jgi:hypothetical protein
VKGFFKEKFSALDIVAFQGEICNMENLSPSLPAV